MARPTTMELHSRLQTVRIERATYAKGNIKTVVKQILIRECNGEIEDILTRLACSRKERNES